ncbi:MAG: hypothetical protein NC206_01830 [Bacteroides sp.]|nr:hypothetical protein [Roseburia sp.]MCM1345807.1 hypothetical protein [Bacteroides sp.]MCM1420535.1 hypothetical protein [Bacteroides sp.]
MAITQCVAPVRRLCSISVSIAALVHTLYIYGSHADSYHPAAHIAGQPYADKYW